MLAFLEKVPEGPPGGEMCAHAPSSLLQALRQEAALGFGDFCPLCIKYDLG